MKVNHRMRSRDAKILACNAAAVVIAVAIAVTAGLRFSGDKHPVTVPRLAADAGHRPSVVDPDPPVMPYLGVYEPSSPSSFTGVTDFAGLISRRPNIAVYYSSWGEPFQTGFAQSAHANGATPMVQIEPAGVNLAAIADGSYDRYLNEYASAVRQFGAPVILAFGHEMNADWYGWGYQRTSPAVFVQAWRHIHDLFAADGARNVKWLWAVNVTGSPSVSSDIRQWWPGSRYVTWVGVEGHYYDAAVKFPRLFGATLGQVGAFTRDPILVSEAGIAPNVSPERITDLFSGAQSSGLIGVVWFDEAGRNISVVDDPAALSALRSAVGTYTRLTPVPLPKTSARRFASDGSVVLTESTSVRSTSTTNTLADGPRSARTTPSGSMSMLRPIPVGARVGFSSGSGTWPAAAIHTVFSIARARSSVTQCSSLNSPACHAALTVTSGAPSAASARVSSGNRMS
jgi:hypothetical protein